jgi:serine/threonine-protein kinase RsbW
MSPLHVHGLDRFVDDVHAQFDAWAEDAAIDDAIGPDGLAVLRLAAHEWVANLAQHAQFCGPAELVVSLDVVDGGVRCQIEDTSQGFDFVRQIGAQQSLLDAPAPSERGRGLLMLVSCAEDLAFREAKGDVSQQIAFTVRAPEDDMFASLFRPEDFAFDVAKSDNSPDNVESRGDGASDATAHAPVHPDPLSS